MPYISTEPVESSNIERIGYHRHHQILRIIFHGGRAYDYPMVTERDFDALMGAESKGKFFNSRIKSMYAHRTPRDVELVEPCCEHPEPNPTCTKECFPCNEWCCPGAPSSASPEEIAAAIKDGLAFGAADHNAASPTTGSDEAAADSEKACLHPDREESSSGSVVVCAACGADLSQSGDCHHGADGRDCETGCGCIPCHVTVIGGGCNHGADGGYDCAEWCSCACHSSKADGANEDESPEAQAHSKSLNAAADAANQEEETNGNSD